MLGQRSKQRGLFEADHLYIDLVGRDSFYGFLAEQRGELFRDEEFAGLYAADVGRPSVPPSLLATALLLQAHDQVSDEEAKQRADFDLRWKVALGIPIEARPYAKSTLQLFRAQMVLHEEGQAILQKTLALARRRGYLRSRKLRVALDTTAILGRGAVKDTYNLLADGITRLVRVLAELAGVRPEVWATGHGLGRYFGSSIKGEAVIEWDNPRGRRAFLSGIVADADRLLDLAGQRVTECGEGSWEARRLEEAGELLRALLLQDIERDGEGPRLRQGTARDRVVSAHDPEMRHGHKSRHRRFDGYKAAVAVEVDSQLITAATVLPANAGDGEGALPLVEASEANTASEVETAIGDCAYGGGELRQEFAAAGRALVARVPAQSNRGYFTKDAFQIDVVAKRCTCPAGHTTTRCWQKGKGHATFRFDAALCGACPLRPSCTPVGRGRGRTVALLAQEALLQAARAYQVTVEGRGDLRQRQVVEHRIARLVQLGVRQARYFGRGKTIFQLLLAAAVANLTLLAGIPADTGALVACIAALCALVLPLATLSTSLHPLPLPKGGTSPAVALPSTQPLQRLQMAVSRPGL